MKKLYVSLCGTEIASVAAFLTSKKYYNRIQYPPAIDMLPFFVFILIVHELRAMSLRASYRYCPSVHWVPIGVNRLKVS
ncbi:hypothetical protein TDB9533_02718 [Thalassocella blandensis]|nr:hypothetical protein TDB9533_02718 [Thalassocella blandensis]